MRFRFENNDKYTVEIPDSNLIGIVEPKKVIIPDEQELFTGSLENPVSFPRLEKFLEGAKTLLIVVNDGTRTTPTGRILQYIKRHFLELDHKIIVACGSHNGPTEQEKFRILGSLFDEYKDRLLVHNAIKSDTVYLGTTSRKTRIRFNRLAVEADRIININSIEPHYFAGYTGGRKSFLPGIASWETIENNHHFALKPGSGILELKGNPVHEDMEEAASVFRKKVFSINLVQDIEARLYRVSCGDLLESFYQAIPDANELFLSRLPDRAEILLAGINAPLNRDLYQSQKGIENCRPALKKGGIMIVISSCRNGIGKEEFYQLLISCKTPEEVFHKIDQGYVLGYHKAAKIAEFLRENQLWMVTDISEELLAPLNIRRFDTVAEALKNALVEKGEKAGITICSDAAVTVPVIEGL